MRILSLQESDWLDVGPHQSHHLLERLTVLGHEVTVIDFEIRWRERGQVKPLVSRRFSICPKPRVVRGSNVVLIRPAFVRAPLVDYATMEMSHRIEIRRQIREFDPDVIVGLGIGNSVSAIREAKKAQVPFVFYAIDELHRLIPQRYISPLGALLEQFCFRNANLVLVINAGLRRYALDMGAPEKRVKILRAGVDVGRYDHADGKRIRIEYGILEDEILLFYMGWLYPFSGLSEVIQELKSPEQQKIKLMILGKGEGWEGLTQKIADLGLENKVILEGWKDYGSLPDYVAAADICILPSARVPIMERIVPLKMYEYIAAGKPVIATALPGVVEEFGSGSGVVYVDNANQLLREAEKLRDTQLWESLSNQAIAASRNWSWTNVVEEFESEIENLLMK
jgi:glycosyltransferase involved in cell wall biosynthesis